MRGSGAGCSLKRGNVKRRIIALYLHRPVMHLLTKRTQREIINFVICCREVERVVLVLWLKRFQKSMYRLTGSTGMFSPHTCHEERS